MHLKSMRVQKKILSSLRGSSSHKQNLDGLNEVRKHLTNDVDGLDFEPNNAMMKKIEKMLFNGQKLTGAYKNFYEHELTESPLMKRGYGYNNAHNMALEIHNVQPQALYSPETVQEFSKWFNKNDYEYWRITIKNKRSVEGKIMNKENFTVKKLMDSLYRNEIQKPDDEVIYCEIQYQRDRSSFAGVVLKITNEKDVILVRQYKEKIIQDVNKYEKIYIGYEPDYINSVKEIFSLEKREYGIEIFFLVYSDVRSSQIIFEELMKNVNKYINTIRGQF